MDIENEGWEEFQKYLDKLDLMMENYTQHQKVPKELYLTQAEHMECIK